MDKIDALPPQIHSCHLDETQIHFTPVKTSNIPRAWDRKPSTSFLARSKPRKVWKRFRSSFNSMKALQQLITGDTGALKESELLLEINTRRDAEDLRGVKRQCLTVQRYSKEEDRTETETCTVRGRSFLETKWASEVSRKRRKLPKITSDMDEHMIVDDDLQVGVDLDEAMAENGAAPGGTTSVGDIIVQDPEEATGESLINSPGPSARLDIGATYPDALPGEPGRLPNGERGVISNIKPLNAIDQAEVRALPTTCATDGAPATDHAESSVVTTDEQKLRPIVATIMTAEKQNTAMAGPVELTAEQESTLIRSALRSSLDGDDTELLNNFLSKAKAKREAKAAAEAKAVATTTAQDPEEKVHPEVVVETRTPERRRVLEDLDANSPSPQKSPSKSEKGQGAGDKEPISTSPVTRRSTRVKSLQRPATPSSLRATLSLRRARGNEFVFLQRTEAQELALVTRRNTRQNKGDSLPPKFTLQSLARQTTDASLNASNDSSNKDKSNKPKKHVSWNEKRLAEFEGDESDQETTTRQEAKATTAKSSEKKRAASSHNSQSEASLQTSGDKAAAAATTAATRGRRMRRLGPPKLMDSTTDFTNASLSPLSPTTASPIAKRKKLAPKSPKATLTGAPSATNDRPSLLSGGRSVKTNLLKVNAGSTPMPRRVRRA